MQHFRRIRSMQEDFETLGLLPTRQSLPLNESKKTVERKLVAKAEKKSVSTLIAESRNAINRALKKKKTPAKKAKHVKAARKYMMQGLEQFATLVESLKNVEAEMTGAARSELVKAFESVAKISEALKLRLDQAMLMAEENEYVGDGEPKSDAKVDKDDEKKAYAGEDEPEEVKIGVEDEEGKKEYAGEGEPKDTKEKPEAPKGDLRHVGDEVEKVKEVPVHTEDEEVMDANIEIPAALPADLGGLKADALAVLEKMKKEVLSTADAEDILKDMVKFLGGAMDTYINLAKDNKPNEYVGDGKPEDEKGEPVSSESPEGRRMGQDPYGKAGMEVPVQSESKKIAEADGKEDLIKKDTPTRKIAGISDTSLAGNAGWDAVVKEELSSAFQQIVSEYDLFNKNIERVEHQSRDGFIPHTDGGYEAKAFSSVGKLIHNNVKSAEANKKISELYDQSAQDALEEFKEKYAKELKGIPSEKINHQDLCDLSKDDLAEELSELELDNTEGENSTVMFSLGAYYYHPEGKGKGNETNQLYVYGAINWEAPYHRSGRGNEEVVGQEEIEFSDQKDLSQKIKIALNNLMKKM